MLKKSLCAASLLVFLGNGCVSIDAVPQNQQTVPPPEQTTSSTDRVMAPTDGSTSTAVQEPTTEPETKTDEQDLQVASTTVMIKNFIFTPDRLVVKKGAKVTFSNKDNVNHTVTADNGAFDSGTMEKDQAFYIETSDVKPGTYQYHCKLHPTMKGTLIVIE